MAAAGTARYGKTDLALTRHWRTFRHDRRYNEGMPRRIPEAALIALLCAACVPALGETCGPLKIVASVQLLASPDEREVFVPVSLQGQRKFMLLDTGGALDEITPQTAAVLALRSYRTPTLRFYDLRGNYVDHATVVPSFAIGNLVGHNVNFVVGPDYLFAGRPDIAGILGPGILRFYDVAVDFGARTFALISPDHCAGKVVYWPAKTVAIVPIDVLKASGHIVVPVTLDGRSINAMLDTGAYTTVLSTSAAENALRLHIPYMYRFQHRVMPYQHRFPALDFGGVAVANPVVDILPGLGRGPRLPSATGTRIADGETERLPDMLIGMDILRHLHLYIAYREQKLYITPSSAPTAPAISTPG
jgi:hypothetical protein